MTEKLPYSSEFEKPPPFGQAPSSPPSDVQEPIDSLGQKSVLDMTEKLPYSTGCDKPPPYTDAAETEEIPQKSIDTLDQKKKDGDPELGGGNPSSEVQAIPEKSIPPQFGETPITLHGVPQSEEPFDDTLGPCKVTQKKFQGGAHDSINRTDEPVTTLWSALRDFISHSIFLVLICIILYPVHWSAARSLTNAVNNLFTRNAAPSGKHLAEVNGIDDIWEYLNNQLMYGLYLEPRMNNSSEFTFDKFQSDKALFHESSLLGQPRIRMVKVNQSKCTIVENLAGVAEPCYADYEKRYEEKTSFSPKGTYDLPAFTYSTAYELDNDDLHGSLASYGGGGFVQYLSEDDKKKSLESIAFLKANRWIGRSTRLVVADFAVFNERLNLFCVIKLIFELPISGGAIPTASIDTLRLIRYTSQYDSFVLVCEATFCQIVLFLIFKELFDICRYRSSYFKRFWNCVNLAVIGISIVCIKLSISRAFLARNSVNKAFAGVHSSYSFDQVLKAENAYTTYAGLLFFCAVLKTFKYIGMMLKQLSVTVKEILVFSGVVFMILFAVAHFGLLVHV